MLVHGSGPHDRDERIGAVRVFKDLAWGLASQGVAVLRSDKRTLVHGQRLAKQQAALTIDRETAGDALAAVARVLTNELAAWIVRPKSTGFH